MTQKPAQGGTPELSIVVPVYNEGSSIASVLKNIDAALRCSHEILVVYDFDEDDTVPVVRDMLSEHPSLALLKNDAGRGALNAIRTGMAAANGRFVLVTMADGSDDANDIEEMLECGRSGASVVAASRYMASGRQVGGPVIKALASRLAGWLLHEFGRVGTLDPTNNYKLYARDYLDKVTIESTRGFELALELTVKAAALNLVIAEVPTVWHDRSFGESKWNARRLLPGYLRWFAFAAAQRLPQLMKGPAIQHLSPASGTKQ